MKGKTKGRIRKLLCLCLTASCMGTALPATALAADASVTWKKVDQRVNPDGKFYYGDNKLDSTQANWINTNGYYPNYNGRYNMGVNGIEYDATGAVQAGAWLFVINGQFKDDYTGIAQNDHGYWYVKDGIVDLTYCGVATNANGTWAVWNGKINFDFTGQYKGFYFENGKAVRTYTLFKY